MEQTFAPGLHRIRQLTADEATVLVWKNDSAARVVTGGRCGHAAIMLRSDKLPIWTQDDIDSEGGQLRDISFKIQDARQEYFFLDSDIERWNAEIAKMGAGGGAERIKKLQSIREAQEKKVAQEAEIKALMEQAASIRIWNNPQIVRWYYLTADQDTGFVRHVYISWWPGGGGVDGVKSMLKTQKGTMGGAWDDMRDEMSQRARQGLERGTIQPRAGQVNLQKTYGFTDPDADTWGKEPDFVISVPALGASNRYWGVNASQMWQWYDEFTDNPDNQYKMISSKSSCAGVALQAMVAGGGEVYSKLRKSNVYVLPNEVAHYAVELRSKIVDFNAKSARFEYKVLQPWAKKHPASTSNVLSELWKESDWRSVRGSKAHTRFSVSDHLKKYHDTDPDSDWSGKMLLMREIFSYVLDQVGDKHFLVSKDQREDALIALGSQCLNVLRDSGSWARA